MGGGGEIIRGVGALGNREDHTTTEYHRMPHTSIPDYAIYMGIPGYAIYNVYYTWVYRGIRYGYTRGNREDHTSP